MNLARILQNLLLLLVTICLLVSSGALAGLPGPEQYRDLDFSGQNAELLELPTRAKRGVLASNEITSEPFYYNVHNVGLVQTCQPGIKFNTPLSATGEKTGAADMPFPQALHAGRPKRAGTVKSDFLRPLCTAFPELSDLIQKNKTYSAQFLNEFARDFVPTIVKILGGAEGESDIRDFLFSNECYNRMMEPMLTSPAFSAIHLNSSDIKALDKLLGRLGDSSVTLDEAEVLPTVKYLLSRSLHDVLVYVYQIYMEIYNTIYNVEFEEFYQIVGAYLFNGEAERMHRPLHDRMLNLLPSVLNKSMLLYAYAQEDARFTSYQRLPSPQTFGDLTVDDVRTNEVFIMFNSIKCLIEHALEEMHGGASNCSKISANPACPFSVPVRRPNPAEDCTALQVKYDIKLLPALLTSCFALALSAAYCVFLRKEKNELRDENKQLVKERAWLMSARAYGVLEYPDEIITMESSN
ncbi:hypothetical protein PAPHI01_1702 [Pancytospora philotis]|nr:hypothetical protein PAPHI01_1702 [Pancytospora philotis]